MRHTRGFTLIEVLLAVAILAVVVGMLYRTLSQSSEAVRHMEVTAEQYRMGRLVLSRITDQLMSVYYRAGDSGDVFRGESIQGDRGLDADLLEFDSLSASVPEEGAGSWHARISYQLKDGRLMLSEVSDLPPVGATYPVAEGLAGFRVRYLEPDNDLWVDEWVGQSRLPKAVEVTLIFPGQRPLGEDQLDGGRADSDEAALLTLSAVTRIPMGEG
ncbi:MAG: prepilin-type N-terminal cleavage/methylation domain-containing protein [Nitrospirota bacterium]|nr:prepilin-type N-terminal cleavage/methylation domain-containing protein [Nitrospirota bacterium]